MSVHVIHDGDIKGTSNSDSALMHETCEVVGQTRRVTNIASDGLIHGIDFDVTQGVTSPLHMNEDAFITIRRK